MVAAVEWSVGLTLALIGFAVGVACGHLRAELTIPFPMDRSVDDQWLHYRLVPAGRDVLWLEEEQEGGPEGYFHYVTVTEPGGLQTRWALYLRERERTE